MTEHDPFDLKGHKEAKKQKTASRKLVLLQEEEDFKWLMSDKRGRRILWWLLEKAGIYRLSYTGNSETFFREGQRNIGLMLIDRFFVHGLEDQFALMQRENRARDDNQ